MSGTRVYIGAEVGGGVDYRTPRLQGQLGGDLRIATTSRNGFHSAIELGGGTFLGASLELGNYFNLTPHSGRNNYLGVYPYGKVEGNMALSDLNYDTSKNKEVFGTDASDVKNYSASAAVGGELFYNFEVGSLTNIHIGAFAEGGARIDKTLPVTRSIYDETSINRPLIDTYTEQPVETEYYNNGIKPDWAAGGRVQIETQVGACSALTLGLEASNKGAEAKLGIKFQVH